MKHIKLYEQFEENSFDRVLDGANILLQNEEFYNNVNSVVSQLPNSLKTKLVDFLSNNKVDIDKIYDVEKKYNIINKVKELYNSGVTKIQDILDRIYPKKEGLIYGIMLTILMIIILAVVMMGTIVLFTIAKNNLKGLILSICLIIAFGVTIISAKMIAVASAAYVEYKINGESDHLKVIKDKEGKVIEVKISSQPIQ